MALVDHEGRLVRFSLKPGNAAEVTELATLLTTEVVADKAFDSEDVRRGLESHGIIPTIPYRSNRGSIDDASYRRRHLVENYFADLKQFRGIATRYCKLAETFAAMVTLAAWLIDGRASR